MNLTEKPTALVALKNILFATDFSDSSFAALPHVAAIARHYEATVYLAHVILTKTYPLVSPEAVPYVLEDTTRNAKEQLRGISKRLEGMPVKFLLAHGEVTDTLTEMIKQHDIDLVVVGTHGRRGVKRFFLGSVAEEVFRNSPCPVLTVGPHVSAKAPEEMALHHIFYPTDLSEESSCAGCYAVSFAAEYEAALTMLHVFPEVTATYPGTELLVNAFQDEMKTLIPAEAVSWCKREFAVEFGCPAERILIRILQ